MSLNVIIYAEREVIVKATDKTEIQRIFFDSMQTSTKDTNLIINSECPLETYKKLIIENSIDEVERVYDRYDYDCIRDYTEIIVNYGKKHVEELDEWIKISAEKGYKIIINKI